MRRLLIILIFILAYGSSRAQDEIARKDYLSLEGAATLSMLTGQSNFFWPYVYPYDSRSPSPSQDMPFTDLGSGFGYKAGLSADFPLFGSNAIRLGIFYRTNSATKTERSQGTGQTITGPPSTEVESIYRSTWTFAGADLLFRVKLFKPEFYGLAGFGFARLIKDRFDATQTITLNQSNSQYVDLPSGQPNGKYELVVTDQKSDNLYKINHFDAKVGLGYFLPLTEGIVLSPEFIANIPLSNMTSEDASDYYASKGATPPSLVFFEMQIGLRFVIGEPQKVHEEEQAASTLISMPAEPAPPPVEKPFATLSGKVRDAATNMPVIADITVLDLDTKDTVASVQTSITGNYNINVKRAGRYSVTAFNRDFLFGSKLVTVSESALLTPDDRDIRLLKDEGTQRLLVFYDVDKFELKPESYPELDRVVRLLKENPGITMVIAGHTDSQGSDEYNQKLSEQRAEAVVDYLLSHRIDASRLQAIGYGKAKPLSTNETGEGRAENRRVEMIVKKK